MKSSVVALLFFPLLSIPSLADEPPRQSWVMDEVYTGPHEQSFNKLRYEVPILMRQTMIDLAVRCGLNFEEGWRFPFEIAFEDNAPGGVENVLAYVEMRRNGRGDLRQRLCINLEAYEREHFNFNKVFAHELVHAMLNDSLGAYSMALPVWFHEGLAVYGADQGEAMVKFYVSKNPDANPSHFLTGLDAPNTGLHYMEDYLAFKYIHDAHGVNSLHNLVREVVKRNGDVSGAIDYTCSEDWQKFQEGAKKFSEEQIFEVGPSLQCEQPTQTK